MDDKYAYKTGDYSSQSSAMDANHFAIEGSGASGFTLWTYTAIVSIHIVFYLPSRIVAKHFRTTMSGATCGMGKIFLYSH
jgi:hypothetical protein